jgi:hypothetical protein
MLGFERGCKKEKAQIYKATEGRQGKKMKEMVRIRIRVRR